MREYVRAGEVAAHIEEFLADEPAGGRGVAGIAERAGVSDRAVIKVLREQEAWPFVGVLMADAILLAVGRCLADVETVWRRAKPPQPAPTATAA